MIACLHVAGLARLYITPCLAELGSFSEEIVHQHLLHERFKDFPVS